MIQINQMVDHDGARWLVTELTTAVGGQQVAQLECLDRDAFATVPVAAFALPGEDLTPEDVALFRQERDRKEQPKRLRHSARMHSKKISKCKSMIGVLSEAIEEAKGRIAAGDARPIENRVLVPGQVITIPPEALVKMAEDALAGLEAQIARSTADRDADEAALSKII